MEHSVMLCSNTKERLIQQIKECKHALLPISEVFQSSITTGKGKEITKQVMFCQRIYKMPEVKTRLYNFDTEQCDMAGQVLADVVSRYSIQDQSRIKAQAEQHAYQLTQYTTEPYQSVTACREYCRGLVETRELRDD